ncbi:MAG: alkaline phosphatase family protein [Halobacteria archaeon]
MGLLDKFSPGGEDGEKVAFIGIDGVPRPLIEQLIEEGRAPNLQAIADAGGLEDMNAVVPAESSACWPAMTTGTNPGKTGVLGFQDRERDSYETYIPLGKHVQSKRVWDMVGDDGRNSLVVNVPVTFPPDEVQGVLVSGFLTPDASNSSSDPEVTNYLENLGYRIDVDASLGHEDKEEFVDDAYETLEKRKEAVLHFMENEDWSLLWNVFMTTDRMNHFLWENYENGDELGEKFLEFYEEVDAAIGEIRDRLPDDASLIVAADHGFCELQREVDMNAWLREEGLQGIEEGGDSLEDITNDTEVYSLIPGRFYINTEGREPRGTVPEDEYEDVRDELAEKLQDLEDPDGNLVVDRVVKREEVYDGNEYEMTPDLVALPNRGFDLKASFENEKPVFKKGARNGMHTFDDATLLFEPGDDQQLDPHKVSDADIMDVTPTVLDLLDIDEPEDIDGETLLKV